MTAVATRVGVVADTHLRAGRPLPDDARAVLETCGAILHAGDIVEQECLDVLASMAPTYAVLGNNDATLVGVVAETWCGEIAGVRIAMIHDSGARTGRAARMKRRFPGADVVVFGHSHIPADEVGVDGQRLFNPGSPTQRRRQPSRTVGELLLADGSVVGSRIVDLGR